MGPDPRLSPAVRPGGGADFHSHTPTGDRALARYLPPMTFPPND